MDTESAARLLDATTKLLGVMVWPAVVTFILVRFGPKISDVIGSLSEFTFKGAGFEASAKKRQNEAAAALVAASASRPEAGTRNRWKCSQGISTNYRRIEPEEFAPD